MSLVLQELTVKLSRLKKFNSKKTDPLTHYITNKGFRGIRRFIAARNPLLAIMSNVMWDYKKKPTLTEIPKIGIFEEKISRL